MTPFDIDAQYSQDTEYTDGRVNPLTLRLFPSLYQLYQERNI